MFRNHAGLLTGMGDHVPGRGIAAARVDAENTELALDLGDLQIQLGALL